MQATLPIQTTLSIQPVLSIQTALSNVPKHLILITAALAASATPLTAATAHSARHHQPTPAHCMAKHGRVSPMPVGHSRTPQSATSKSTTPLRDTAKQGLTLHPDRGYRLLYSFAMNSQALFDMSAALRQQDPNADTSHAPKMILLTALKGTVELVPLGSLSQHGTDDRIQVLCTLRPAELRLEQNGVEVTEPLAQLRQQLAEPILVEYTHRGQIASVRFNSDCDTTAQGFARTLLAYLQVTLPNDFTQPTWQAREAEPNGIFMTRYTRQTATPDVLTVNKIKCGPASTAPQATAGQLQATQTVTPGGTLTLTLDARRGLIRTVYGAESFATVLGTAPVARSRNTISLALLSRLPLSSATNRSLLSVARQRRQQSGGRTLAQSPEITPQQEARIQRANLGDATVEQVLAQLAALDGSTTPEKQANALLPRLKACIYLYPEILFTLRAQLQSAPADKIRMALIAEALRAAGTPAAQRLLIAVLDARHREVRAAGLLIPTLAQLQAPIPQVEAVLAEMAFGKGGDPLITSTACLALGVLAHTLSTQAPERANHLTQVLQYRLLQTRSNEQKRTLLLALANAAQPSTLPTLLHQAHDHSPEVRGSALLALGRLPGEQAERPICAALTTEPDANVRLAAAMAAKGKLSSAAVRQGLLQVLQRDHNTQVRIKALYTLWNGARSRPEVEAGVQQAAKQDASEDVRQAALTLLAAK
jgi:hypothetical protein